MIKKEEGGRFRCDCEAAVNTRENWEAIGYQSMSQASEVIWPTAHLTSSRLNLSLFLRSREKERGTGMHAFRTCEVKRHTRARWQVSTPGPLLSTSQILSARHGRLCMWVPINSLRILSSSFLLFPCLLSTPLYSPTFNYVIVWGYVSACLLVFYY